MAISAGNLRSQSIVEPKLFKQGVSEPPGQPAGQNAGHLLSAMVPTLLNALLGIVAGLLSVPLVSLATRLWQTLRKRPVH